ncbi:universal stress protein [Beijerinckia indica]|uniref:UspA domain protein n=1 Tax=Beijerinckia indica subsp. indica (strain ATCC 9039 / DSM 1715 / NCIMB 8712) TaxID=395963 RepID=B2IBF4_BEII9|nr:universal stress protein [Beijerinckia indica]ACB96580.1 UspA domain protein [Beijerinckia indica subsp. indica ATCC 9039]
MKGILLPIEDHVLMDSVMETTLLLARQFGSTIEGAALGPNLAELVAADFSLSGVILDDRARRELFEASRRRFDAFMAGHQVPRHTDESTGLSCDWMGDTLVSDNGIGEYARVFDLVVVGLPGAGAGQPRRTTFEAALFESGRPVLIATKTPPPTLGETIVIAWNGNTDTARTIAFAMPLLLRAQDVIVISVPGLRLPGPPDEAVVRGLRRHGIKARTQTARAGQASSGHAILEAATELGADLLIKGGYTQSRLRQLIFGGVTSEILAETHLPVFMAH